MTETVDTPPAPITGVAPVIQPDAIENTPPVKRRVVGSDAEAALRERHAKAREEELLYPFRGKEYRLQTPMPAAFMVHAGQIQSADGSEVDMREFVSAIRSAFVGEDGPAFVEAMLDTSVDVPADAEFISEVLADIVQAVTSRPSTN